MPAKERDVTLELLLGASQKLTSFLLGYNLEKFLGDQKTQSAVIMQFIIIGELAKKLPDEVKNKINLPWKLMAGFRDLAVHEYFELDLKQIWETAHNDVPNVTEKLKSFAP
jgi:uncharacterized protein with HEPN domain